MYPRGLFFAVGLLAISHSVNSQCSDRQSLTFSRWSGVTPERVSPVFVYSARGDEPSLSAVCLARCRELPSCYAVTLVHGKGHCYGLADSANTLLRVDNDATYFEKICVELPNNCSLRWWAVESTPGYHLHSEDRNLKVIINATAQECYSAVLETDGQKQLYRSAQWVSLGEDFDAELIRKSELVTGNCLLNAESKFTEPESFRVANFHTLYIENHCRHDYPEKIDRCSYEEYYNQTLRHVELTLNQQTKDECKTACELEQRFVCRGFTWRVSGSRGECALHSEDLLTVGSWLMSRAPAANYYRRVICLNITVECSAEELIVRYHPRGVFRGRVYVPGRGERCGARAGGAAGGAAGSGGGARGVTLTLPLQGDCDVNFAYAIINGPNGPINRTMAYVMVMIQNNAIIQTAGDRWVRVGCSPLSSPQHRVHATIAVLQHTKPSLVSEASLDVTSEVAASAVYNNTGWSPPLTMYIVRADHGPTGAPHGPTGTSHEPTTAPVSLGELLELRVETTDEAEIEAYHLVASSRLGDSSVLLLDSRGCPTGQVDFPAFSRTWVGATQRLLARFKAFRFPTSHVVRFAIMIRFCDGRCSPRNCGGKGRTTRETNETFNDWSDESVSAAVREESGWRGVGAGAGAGAGVGVGAGVVAQSGAGGPCGGAAPTGRVPLELELVVGSRDVLSADTLVRADHRDNIPSEVLSASAASPGAGSVVCMHELVVVALALGWLAVQLLLLVGCCILVKRYRNLAEMSLQKDYQSFDNVGFESGSTVTHRRVHWPDQNVDILHAN